MNLEIKSYSSSQHATITVKVSDEVAKVYTELKEQNPDITDFEALKKAKQSIEGVTILSKEEAWKVFHRSLMQKEIETGKSQMEIFREMEFSLSKKEEESLTTSERIMLQALRDVEQKFYGNF